MNISIVKDIALQMTSIDHLSVWGSLSYGCPWNPFVLLYTRSIT